MGVRILACIPLPVVLFGDPSWAELRLKTVPPERVGTGKTLVVLVETAAPLRTVEARFMQGTYPLFPVPERRGLFRAFLGIPLKAMESRYPLQVQGVDTTGELFHSETSIHVFQTFYPEERISIVSEKRHLLTSKALEEEIRLFNALLSPIRPEKCWSGRFALPVHGRVSSPFGLRRIYNDGIASWQHRGVDLAAPEGTPVVAPNGGEILLSRYLTVHGNTVVIDHGQGVFSILVHLRDMAVPKGQRVRKGDLVGTVGQTGMANAPHLHWGLSVGNHRIDPLEWTERAMEGDSLNVE